MWLGSSWTGLTAERPALSPPAPLTALSGSHGIGWLYFTPGTLSHLHDDEDHHLSEANVVWTKPSPIACARRLPKALGFLLSSGLDERAGLDDETVWLGKGVSRAIFWRKASSLRRLANQLYTRTSVTRLDPRPASWEGDTPRCRHSALGEGVEHL